MKAWHFLKEDRRLRWGSEEVVEASKTIKVDCEPVLCKSGLHASVKPIDALTYAPGPIVCRVDVSGRIVEGKDKIVGTERTVIAMADATDVLRAFARWCALQVIHLWDAPDVVKEFLETGNEELRAAARAAARDAARAARDAARDAAVAAAWDAALDAAVAARAAARDAARAAARAAAWDATWAAQAAARVAWAAWDDFPNKANNELETKLFALLEDSQ